MLTNEQLDAIEAWLDGYGSSVADPWQESASTTFRALVGELRAERTRTETALSRLTMERDASWAFAREGVAKEGETYQHDLAAARGWAFGLAVSLLDGSDPAAASVEEPA